MHVKDMKTRVRFKGDGGDPAQWTELFPQMTDAGTGVLDLPAILGQARKSGVEHFFLEQDLVSDPDASLRRSYRYLSSLEV
jgi:sugar phosphate isomerase/epimerase